MGLLDDLQPPSENRLCAFAKTMKTLSEADQNKLVEALANEKWSSMGLTNALKDRGIIVTRHSLHDHRTKVCPCSKI